MKMVAENDINVMKCVKNYSQPGQCITCFHKQAIDGTVQKKLTKLIDDEYFIWAKLNWTVASCKSETISIFQFFMQFFSRQIAQYFENIHSLFRLHESVGRKLSECVAHAE